MQPFPFSNLRVFLNPMPILIDCFFFRFVHSLQIKTKDEQKYKRVHEEVLKKMDKYENDNQPQVSRTKNYFINKLVFDKKID